MTDAHPPDAAMSTNGAMAADASTAPPTATYDPATADPSARRPVTRIGSAERQQAMDALDVHMSAGRLDPDEYGERVGRASVARTSGDLEPLFTDLPLPHAMAPATVATTAPAAETASVPRPSWTPPVAPSPPPVRQKFNGREPLGGRLGEVAVAASPFIALILFFATMSFWNESWLFFLMIPLVGAVVYGRDWHDNDNGNDRDRRRRNR